jgi:hypothetical protein
MKLLPFFTRRSIGHRRLYPRKAGDFCFSEEETVDEDLAMGKEVRH